VINVQNVLREIPHFEVFCSVEKLHGLVERLHEDPSFDVTVAGASANGVPIHHVRFGTGSVKALFIGGPHAHEAIGSLTVFSLMTLLHQGNRALRESDVEWHIIPCIDPDGAVLNEGWSQKPFTLADYVRNFYLQPRSDQVDFSFPITHKKLVFDRPSTEARVLQGILDRVRPDFCFTLHNFAPMGGTWYALSHDIGHCYYRQIRELLQQHHVTLQPKSVLGVGEFAEGMRHLPTMKNYYDYLEQTGGVVPEEYVQGKLGAGSHEYLLEIKPDALVFVAELTYGQHPSDASEKDTGQSLRQLNLRLFADNKYLASLILAEWEKVIADLDTTSPYFRKILNDLVAVKHTLHEGVTGWYEQPIQSLLFNPEDDKTATERDRVQAYMYRTYFMGNAYAFVRLLKVSKQTRAVQEALHRMERAFTGALNDMYEHLALDSFAVIDCDRLAKAQLGSGLIALNSVLEKRQHEKTSVNDVIVDERAHL
jgi:hypothetical protein